MLCEVPAPAWYTSTMNWSRSAPAEHLVCGGDDGAANLLRQHAGRHVGRGRRFLDQDGRGDELVGGSQPADGKVLCGALGLDAVVGAGRDGVLAEGIAFQCVHAYAYSLYYADAPCVLRQRARIDRQDLDRSPARCPRGDARRDGRRSSRARAPRRR